LRKAGFLHCHSRADALGSRDGFQPRSYTPGFRRALYPTVIRVSAGIAREIFAELKKHANPGTLRVLLIICYFLLGCNSEILDKQAEQLRQQETEIARQRKEIDALMAGQKVQDQKLRDCNRAFREYFDKAQTSGEAEAIVLYREGLVLCPDDDVAHYELGKLFAAQGRYSEAEQEFEATLKINPDFADAKTQLDSVRKHRQ
jgi:tetratricopeptide (TPR) repeat protein